MFFGEYSHTLDAKGRIIIPSKFRDELGEKFIITKGLDNCLFVYSLEEWGNVVAKLRTLPFTDADVRKFIRFFSAGATECEPDKQGRVVIPQTLRDHAKLEKDLYITGSITRLEIWNKEKWEQQSGEYSNDADKIAEKMSILGI